MMTKEKALSDMTSRVLSAVAIVYGKASSEYEVAGGSRYGESRRSRSTVAAAAEAAVAE
jgi:hypothetical protein